MDEGHSSVQPLNHRAKDTFFKKVYESPERLRGLAEFLLGRDAYLGDLLDYALTANSLTYVQKVLKVKDSVQYPLLESITSVADMFLLLMERGVFVDLFQNQEVCDMTVAEFSRDNMFFYQGKEEGREEGIKLTKSVIRLDEEEYAVSDIATELQISEEEVKRILEE